MSSDEHESIPLTNPVTENHNLQVTTPSGRFQR